jgi:hypothetical protein
MRDTRVISEEQRQLMAERAKSNLRAKSNDSSRDKTEEHMKGDE